VYENVLTERGRRFQPVLLALYAWSSAESEPGDRTSLTTGPAP
jgi:hypothetical protein